MKIHSFTKYVTLRLWGKTHTNPYFGPGASKSCLLFFKFNFNISKLVYGSLPYFYWATSLENDIIIASLFNNFEINYMNIEMKKVLLNLSNCMYGNKKI